jgi:DNA relaxase NicK
MAIDNEIKKVGIDYFTLTIHSLKGREVWDKCRTIHKTLEGQYKERDWRFYGYHGFVFSSGSGGHFAYGDSHSEVMGTIVQASGLFAQRYVKEFFVTSARWTRLDLCVDVELSELAPDLAQNYYDWITDHTDSRQRKYSLVINNRGGSTLYVGSRQSDEFGRCYDKGVEENDGAIPGRLWRYEIELKREKAKQAALSIASYATREKTYSHPVAVTVYDWFCRRNVPPVYKRTDAEGLDLHVDALSKTDDARLIWLRKQVSPTVRELLMSDRREVLDALGITDYYKLDRKR